MPKGFHPRAGAEFEVQAILDPVLRDLAARVERKAKRNLQMNKIRDTGKLERSIKAGPVQHPSIGKSMVVVRAVRFNTGSHPADVALIIELGHNVIRPKAGNQIKARVLKSGQRVAPNRGNFRTDPIAKGNLVFEDKRGNITFTDEVRAVSGVQYMFRALETAAYEIRTETGNKVWFSVKQLRLAVDAPGGPPRVTERPPSVKISRARSRARRRSA